MSQVEATKIWKRFENPEYKMKLAQNALIPYFTFGDPDIETTKSLILESLKAGADCIELGLAFSDPIADGPVIQASHQRVLEKYPDMSIDTALDMVSSCKDMMKGSAYSHIPIIFMASSNLILSYGIEAFFKSAKSKGLDGIIIPDLPLEEGNEFQKEANEYNIAIILLISPLTTGKRMRKIVKATQGFLYLISTTGTTGERSSVNQDLKETVSAIKKIRNIPVIVGFGISQPEQYKEVCSFADGVIVGSHLVKMKGDVPQISARLKAFKDHLSV